MAVIMYHEFIDNGFPVCRWEGGLASVILKNGSLSAHVGNYTFQLNIGLTSSEMFKVAEWCDENLKDDYLVGNCVSGFEDKSDVLAFKLRWF